MEKTATEVMHEILFSAFVEGIDALRKASKGMPNTMARDVASIHANSTIGDLPPELQTALKESTTAAFKRLRGAGYTVSQPLATSQPRRSAFPKPNPNRRGGQQ